MGSAPPDESNWKRARAKPRHDRNRARLRRMNVKVRKIEVDAETADLLEARAAALGMSIAELLADLACNDRILPPDLAEMRARGEGPWSRESLDEDAHRLAEFERTRMGVPWDEIKTWMESWGKANELPRPKPRKL
jgi:hypothetical protein